MRRNHENTYALAHATHKEVVDIRSTILRLESKLDAVANQVHKATFDTVMGQGCDISEFFPVESNEQLNRFMDRENSEWNSRKNEFYHFLYTIASNTKKGFARGMIKALFTRSYIVNIKWPSSG